MTGGLTGVLSGPAADLYHRLVGSGGLPLAELTTPDLAPARDELVDRGFARERHSGEPTLVPIEPALAVENAILVAQQQFAERYRSLLRAREQVRELQRTYLATAGGDAGPTDQVRLLTDPDEISFVALGLVRSTRGEVLRIETGQAHPVEAGDLPEPGAIGPLPPEVLARGVRCRAIISRAVLDTDGARETVRGVVEAGWDCRLYPSLPMKLILVDDQAALLPLGPTGRENAALVRAPELIATLRTYFELLWHRAVPIGEDATRLGSEPRRVLRLVLAGLTDRAISRHLGVSERTVRRHVGVLLERLGASNRVTLAVVAIRDGWAD